MIEEEIKEEVVEMNDEQVNALVRLATIPPIAVTLVYSPITGLSLSVLGTDDQSLIEQGPGSAIKGTASCGVVHRRNRWSFANRPTAERGYSESR